MAWIFFLTCLQGEESKATDGDGGHVEADASSGGVEVSCRRFSGSRGRSAVDGGSVHGAGGLGSTAGGVARGDGRGLGRGADALVHGRGLLVLLAVLLESVLAELVGDVVDLCCGMVSVCDLILLGEK